MTLTAKKLSVNAGARIGLYVTLFLFFIDLAFAGQYAFFVPLGGV